ncbi:MAG: hypothetical protein IJ730_03200 [Alphaproteobacteria bacterium]|nr:hypothetical protein [Alphaproteobacteria bacterium]
MFEETKSHDGRILVTEKKPIVREYLRPDGTKVFKILSEVIEFYSTRYDPRYISVPGGGDNVRVYHKLDGTELLLDWMGKALRLREKPQPPRFPKWPRECAIV